MNLKPRREQTPGDGREFLRTPRGLRYKTGGGALLASAFTGDIIKGGTAVYQNADGYFVPIPATGTPLSAEAVETACLTAHSVTRRDGENPVCGYIVAGHPLEDRCTGVTAEFKDATKGRLVFGL